MNKCIFMGRITRDPEIRQSGEMSIAKFSLAVDRRGAKDGQQTADFINCVAFAKQAEFCDKYLHKGTKIVISSHVVTGSYTNKDGQKVYTTDFAIDEIEFAESKNANGQAQSNGGSDYKPNFGNPADSQIPNMNPPTEQMQMGFLNVPPTEMEDLPFGAITR